MPYTESDTKSDAEPNAKSYAEPDNAKSDGKSDDKILHNHDAKPNAEPNTEPDVCTDQLHCFGVGPMVGLQPAVRRRIPETQSRGSHRRPVWRRLPGGERFV